MVIKNYSDIINWVRIGNNNHNDLNNCRKEICAMDERDDIFVLIDEDGREVEFELLDTIEMNDNEYVVLLPLSDEDSDDETDEVVILRIEQDENGEDSFVSVEDEDELDAVFEEFKSRIEDEYDFEE